MACLCTSSSSRAVAWMRKILAIDPGNMHSGYVVVEHDGAEIRRVMDKGKVENAEVFDVIRQNADADVAIEMVASYGMAVGAEVFDTCVWIGRFAQAAGKYTLIYRKDEKLYLCGRLNAKDANITQALCDRFAAGQPNRGKGTARLPGFFHGFYADIWQAMAVAVTYFDKHVRGVQL